MGSPATTDQPRACIVRHSYYPNELSIKREADALRADGFHVSVICLRRDGQRARETIDGVDVARMPLSHRRGAIAHYLVEYNLFFLLASITLAVMHLRRRLTVVQVNTMPDYLAFVALFPRLTGARVVLHVHEPMPELFGTIFPGRKYALLMYLIRVSERWSIRFADRVLTVTEQMKERLVERGANPAKITVVPNVPDARMLQVTAADGTPTTSGPTLAPRYVITHGAIEERYGPDIIVRALALLPDFPELEFHLLGEGEYVPEVLALAAELGVSGRVRYLGFVPHDMMLTEVCNAEAGIVPMRSNEYSNLVHTNKMYEYIEFGRPVIASRLRSVEAYFGSDAIAYFTPDDAADLAARVRETLNNPADGARRAQRASAVYQALRWEGARETYLGVYRSLLSRH